MPTLNSIDDRLQSIEDALVGGVKHVMKWPLWTKIVAVVGLILLVVLLITVFRKKPETNQEYLQEIKALDQKIDALQQGNALRDSIILDQLEDIKKSKQTQTQIIHRYEQIPNNVMSLDRDELRRQVTDY